MLPEQQQRILGYFIEEARDHLNTIEQGLLNLQETLNDQEMINEVFRAAHSIKGGAAMLSLNSIQRTAHRLEDCFKVLKENPITVDQKLESLFLGVSDTLKALLEHLSGPFGLSEEAAANLMSEAEPVFGWLNEHLESLLGTQNGTTIKVSTLEPLPSRDVIHPYGKSSGLHVSTTTTTTITPVSSAEDWQQFQSGVLQKLRDMLQLFKQDASDSSRRGLEACLQYLVIIGQDLKLTNWCHLCKGAATAVTNPDNSYLTLAKIIITEIKTALELAIAGLDASIAISPQLEALIAVPDISLLELSSDFFDSKVVYLAPSESIVEITDLNQISDHSPFLHDIDFDDINSDDINSLFDITEQLDFEIDITDITDITEIEVTLDSLDTIESLFELSDDIEEIEDVNDSDDKVAENINDLSALNGTSAYEDHHGPEVGIAELTELDELFKDDASELDDINLVEQLPEISVGSGIENYKDAGYDVDASNSELDDLLVIDSGTNFYERPNRGNEELTVVQLFGSSLDDVEELVIVDNNLSNPSVDSIDDITGSLDDVEELVIVDNNLSNPSVGSIDDITGTQISPSVPEFSDQTEDDFASFWSLEESEVSSESVVLSSVDDSESVASILESSLFAATASDDIFDGYIELEKSGNLSLSFDDVNDLFEELTPSQIAAVSDYNNDDVEELQQLHFSPIEPEFIHPTSSSPSVILSDDDIWNFDTSEVEPQVAPETIGQTFDIGLNDILDDTELNIELEHQVNNVSSNSEISDNFLEQTFIIEETEYAITPDKSLKPHSEAFNSDLIGNDEFAALEALLVHDNGNSEVEAPLNIAASSRVSSNSNNIDAVDEFGDLEKMLVSSDTIGGTSQSPNAVLLPRNTNRRSTARFEQLMKVSVKHLDDMSNLVGELVVNRNTLEQDQERLRQSLDNLLIQIHHLSDVGARMQELYERSLLEASLLATRKHSNNGGYSTPISNKDSDRGFSELEMDRFTPFHTLSQEMIELIVRVRESASDIDFVTEETERVARQFRQVTTQLQEGLTKARMVPFSIVTDRVKRGVRDNAIKCGKQVELVIEGQDTLIDKMILEHLTDPLIHMLNNAIAHGIETPDERTSKGKQPVGIITVRAFHQGNQTVISVSDDGAGINADYVKQKAIKVGLITPEQAQTISYMEVYELLFQPNFSTKDQADDLAGRGVGMDVVRTSISEIRGTITTDSTLGKGTNFTIRLPLTLSICKALCCVWDKARIAFPMDGVEDTLDISTKSIQKNAQGELYILWRDTKLPFKPLKELLTLNRQLSRGSVYGGTRDDDMVSVVVIRSASTLIGLQVDSVLSEQEIVIKQFEGPAPKPIGVAGATVLGDGRIMPIADVLEIIDIFQGRTAKQSPVPFFEAAGNGTESTGAKIDPTVLIVDDSITVRELLSLSFNKAGYRVEQARDGQEAWEKLRSGLPCDIVFCDIEMPRCDGLELLSRISKEPSLSQLPIAMLTSRGADKHKQMAINLGASGYFTKPYLEEALLEAASRMLKGEKLVGNGNG
ncbi:MAG: response regulator [Calothrix sp. FI2-JRJ7]|nr:response regulator [Calothrix sp. FI2-JRJ7]